jgi:hypothetical protein
MWWCEKQGKLPRLEGMKDCKSPGLARKNHALKEAVAYCGLESS